MTVEAPEKPATSGRGGARGPRQFKEQPTNRDRVIGESLGAKVEELTGRKVSLLDVLAVKFSLSRWYEDPATKELMKNMDAQLKKAEAQKKAEKARADLEAAERELAGITDEDGDEDSDSDNEDATEAAAADSDDDDFDGLDDDDDDKVSAEF